MQRIEEGWLRVETVIIASQACGKGKAGKDTCWGVPCTQDTIHFDESLRDGSIPHPISIPPKKAK